MPLAWPRNSPLSSCLQPLRCCPPLRTACRSLCRCPVCCPPPSPSTPASPSSVLPPQLSPCRLPELLWHTHCLDQRTRLCRACCLPSLPPARPPPPSPQRRSSYPSPSLCQREEHSHNPARRKILEKEGRTPKRHTARFDNACAAPLPPPTSFCLDPRFSPPFSFCVCIFRSLPSDVAAFWSLYLAKPIYLNTSRYPSLPRATPRDSSRDKGKSKKTENYLLVFHRLLCWPLLLVRLLPGCVRWC